jgi:D-aminoacyl-tRNA deacylase
MRAVIQRVSEASVTVDGRVIGSIGRGLVVLLGIAKGDQASDAEFLVEKTVGLRIFPDAEGKMNQSVADVAGALLVVSQFTLYGDCSRGRRPSFDKAAAAEDARVLYEYFVRAARDRGIRVETGIFQATMSVQLMNEGPVTLIIDS